MVRRSVLPQEQEQVLKEALREVEREQQRVGFAERPVDMEYLKNTCAACDEPVVMRHPPPWLLLVHGMLLHVT